MAAFESSISAASLNNFAASTSALAEITLDSPILLYLAAAAISLDNSAPSYISLINTLSI
jgi:hypothetical protein